MTDISLSSAISYPHRTRQRSQWELPTWGLLAVVYGGWLLWTAVIGVLPMVLWPLGGLLLCLHASLQHELIHGHPTRHEWINTALGFLPLSLWLPYSRFATLHRQHHRCPQLTNPLDDPETGYVTATYWQTLHPLQQAFYWCNQTLLGRLVIGPWWLMGHFFYSESLEIVRGTSGRRRQWGWHLLGVVVVVSWLYQVAEISLLAYIMTMVWPGVALLQLRTYLEHRPGVDNHHATALVEAEGWLRLLFLNNNYHLLHHQCPHIPWYQLPAEYQRQREQLLQDNGGFLIPGYRDLLRYLWRPKDAPWHPGGVDHQVV